MIGVTPISTYGIEKSDVVVGLSPELGSTIVVSVVGRTYSRLDVLTRGSTMSTSVGISSGAM
jgi:hypothetical protein